jgi:hypothetical protein
MLARSFEDRLAGVFGSEHALDNAFWTSPAPASVWEALDRIDPRSLNTLVQVYDFISRVGPAWDFVKWMNNIWLETSRGFSFVATDPAALQAALASSECFCVDTRIGGLMHSGQTCYREVSRDAGLHCCISAAEQDIHIDWRSPVECREKDGSCNYAGFATIEHWAHLSHARSLSRFERADVGLDTAHWLIDIVTARGFSLVNERAELAEVERLMSARRRMLVAGAAGEPELAGLNARLSALIQSLLIFQVASNLRAGPKF